MISEESWFLCLKCQRAYQHNQKRPSALPGLGGDKEDKCAYNDCTGLFPEDVLEWEQVLKLQDLYPHQTRTGVKYPLQ